MINGLNEEVDAVGGPTLGADPIAVAVSVESYRAGNPMPAFIIRKKPKGHGKKEWIEGKGNLNRGATVVILEDVVTTGGSVLKAAEKAKDEGFEVAAILAIVDREDGGAERIRNAGYRFKAIFSKSDIMR